ncbi:MAG: CDP-alcohol phosphatidyltransferase family protein [Proteobacteria bacterium]|nr:CDP-alcohol phosphatidyltransferase family protein [Pseudomonadota bacterium]
MNSVPIMLTALRALLAPTMVALALWAPRAGAFAACLITAFLSDVFDGILARRLGVATPALRRLDSLADSLFYGSATYAIWHLNPEALRSRWPALALLAALELSRYAFDLVKFGRETSYHMWSSKAWGIALFIAFFTLLVAHTDGVLVDVAIYAGIAADLEGLAISVTLREWRTDVPSLVHAHRLRARRT